MDSPTVPGYSPVSKRRVAVVTGANKGIGFGIVRNLCQQFDGDVILTSRNVDLGLAAVEKLKTENASLNPIYHQLDITVHSSVVRLHDFLQKNYEGIDVLVNNAAIAYTRGGSEPFAEQAENTMKINFFGTLDVCKTLFPLLRPHGRVVNVSSRVGNIAVISDQKLKSRLLSPEITMVELDEMMQKFVELSKTVPWEKLHEHGFYINRGSFGAYAVSKVGVTIMTRILQHEVDTARPDDDILVNAACPGYINTDMTSGRGWGTVEQGADTITYLALLPPADAINGKEVELPRGQFVAERRVINYDNFSMSL